MVQQEKLCSFAYPSTHLHVLLVGASLLGDFEANRLVCACCYEPLKEDNLGGVFFDAVSRCGLAACNKVDCVDKVGALVLGVPMSCAR